MCLIAYSPDGKAVPRDILDFARATNPDGIGVMSRHGIEKFYGTKYYKRARRYLRQIEGAPHAIHLRWTTHGEKCVELCHPFNVPNSDVYVMHNGVIGWAAAFIESSKESDTSVFVHRHMPRPPRYESPAYREYLDKLEDLIDYGNKLVLFHADSGKWAIANEDEGVWIDGIWYSNEYSLPHTRRSYSKWNWASRRFTGATYGGTAYGDDNVDEVTILPSSDYADRNVSDALDGRHRERFSDPTSRRVDEYYARVAQEVGYHDEGIDLGSKIDRALMRRAEGIWADDWPHAAIADAMLTDYSEE